MPLVWTTTAATKLSAPSPKLIMVSRRAVVVEAGEAIAGNAAAHRKLAAQHDAAYPAGWQSSRPTSLNPRPGVKVVSTAPRSVRRAIWFSAVPLTLVKRPPMRIRPSELHRNRPHRVARARSRVKAQVHRAIGIQAGDVRPRGPVDGREVAADDRLAVRLNRDGEDVAVGPQTHLEPRIQRAVVIEPGDIIARHGIEGGEPAADQQFAVWTDERLRGRIDRVVRARARVEGRVHGAVERHPGQEIMAHVVEVRERAAERIRPSV